MCIKVFGQKTSNIYSLPHFKIFWVDFFFLFQIISKKKIDMEVL